LKNGSQGERKEEEKRYVDEGKRKKTAPREQGTRLKK